MRTTWRTRVRVAQLDTLILVEEEALYIRSTAALHIARRLQGMWPLLAVLLLVLAPLRDLLYEVIAHNRHRWFGKRDACRDPGRLCESAFWTERRKAP